MDGRMRMGGRGWWEDGWEGDSGRMGGCEGVVLVL